MCKSDNSFPYLQGNILSKLLLRFFSWYDFYQTWMIIIPEEW